MVGQLWTMEDRDIDPAVHSDPVNASPAAPSVDGRHLSTITDSTLIHAGGSEPKRDGRPRTEVAAALPGLEAVEGPPVQSACAPRTASTTSAVLHGTASTQSSAAAASSTLASALRPSAAPPVTVGTCARVLRARKAHAAADLASSSAAGGSTSVKTEAASSSAELCASSLRFRARVNQPAQLARQLHSRHATPTAWHWACKQIQHGSRPPTHLLMGQEPYHHRCQLTRSASPRRAPGRALRIHL